jgi:alpha-mannosidase
MYADPSKIRDNVVKVRLNDAEAQLLDALVTYTGEQKASLIRELLLEQAQRVLFGEINFPANVFASEVPQLARVAA